MPNGTKRKKLPRTFELRAEPSGGCLAQPPVKKNPRQSYRLDLINRYKQPRNPYSIRHYDMLIHWTLIAAWSIERHSM